jgi:phosphoribosylamine--glycine ligase
MIVLLIGSGGRENALAHSISKSQSLTRLYISPGNPGTGKLGDNIDLNLSDHTKVIDFCKENKIELVVIGPEKYLVEGLGDSLRNAGIKVFGPNANAAAIEGSKVFSKDFMRKYNIPTAEFKEFGSEDAGDALDYLKKQKYPCVIKADGLAAGKGVIICSNYEEASSALDSMFRDKLFGSAGNKIVIEEFMEGEEASIFAITDGKKYICLPSAQDHKRIGDNDTGKNTGGMGAYSPAPVVTEAILDETEKEIIQPVLKGMAETGREFSGCLYCGLMITKTGVKVVEFNCRFGDPETQAVLPLLEGDFLKLLYSSAAGELDTATVKYNGGASVCIVAASKGYPDNYKTGLEITGLDKINNPDITITHAGTKSEGDKILTSGGRVLGVTAVLQKPDLKSAKKAAYEAIKEINFDGMYYRKDISDKAYKH